jgi:hypothetical protein
MLLPPALLGRVERFFSSAVARFSSWWASCDACRQAFRELMLWLEEDTGGDRQEIAMLMGMVAHVGICQVSNTFHTARCTIARGYLSAIAEK